MIRKIFLSILGLFVFLIPTYLYFIAKYLLQPEGFWQNIFLLIISLCTLGPIQLIFLMLFAGWFTYLWQDY